MTVKHFGAAAGITQIYKVNNGEISVETDCDFQDCKRELIYKRRLRKAEGDSLYQFLLRSRINGLKTKYIDEDVYDGLHSSLQFNVSGMGSGEIQISNVDVPVAERLYREIDKHIDSAKFRFYIIP